MIVMLTVVRLAARDGSVNLVLVGEHDVAPVVVRAVRALPPLHVCGHGIGRRYAAGPAKRDPHRRSSTWVSRRLVRTAGESVTRRSQSVRPPTSSPATDGARRRPIARDGVDGPGVRCPPGAAPAIGVGALCCPQRRAVQINY